MNLIQHFVNGKSYKGNSNKKSKVFNPATGEQQSEVILGTKEDLNKTVEISKKAFESSTVLLRSSLLPNITSDSCSPVAGLKTFPFLFELPLYDLPFTKCCIKLMRKLFN